MPDVRVILTVCSNHDLHVNDPCKVVFQNITYHVIKLSLGIMSWYEPDPHFVFDFFNNANIQVILGIKHGVCKVCYEIIEQSQTLIKEVGGR